MSVSGFPEVRVKLLERAAHSWVPARGAGAAPTQGYGQISVF